MRLVLFDVDGTLLSTGGAGSRAMSRAFQQEYGLADPLRGIRFAGNTDALIISEALRRAGLETGEGIPARLAAAYVRFLEEELARANHFQVLDGVRELLEALEGRPGFLIGLATGNMRPGAWLKVQRAGLAHFFSCGGFGSDSPIRSALISTAVQRGLRVCGETSFERVFLVGDTPRDVLHGRRAGVKTVAVASGFSSWRELKACSPGLLVASLSPLQPVLQYLESGVEGGTASGQGS